MSNNRMTIRQIAEADHDCPKLEGPSVQGEPTPNFEDHRRAFPEAGALGGKCGERAEALNPRLGLYYACVLPKGHDGDHQKGGTCLKHGAYVGDKCPSWPWCADEIKFTATIPAPREEEGAGAKLPREAELRKLVMHLWIYSGYPNGGHQYMESELKAIWDCMGSWPESFWMPAAPVVEEAPRVVTWRVDYEDGLQRVFGDEVSARAKFAAAASMQMGSELKRITTIEEVIEVRTKESADGK